MLFITIQKDLISKCLVQNNNILKYIINYSQQKYTVSVKLMLWKHNPYVQSEELFLIQLLFSVKLDLSPHNGNATSSPIYTGLRSQFYFPGHPSFFYKMRTVKVSR